jgi:LDH2 family malate/lactate/ureidoglycolate dehydrogenase
MTERAGVVSHLVRIDDLRACATDVLSRLGQPDDHAAMVADLLVDSELRGYEDHGVAILGYVPVIGKAISINLRPTIRTVSETDNTLLLDGDHGWGVMPGVQAMEWCIERARKRRGIACATVRNAGHVVTSAPYVERAARAGTIGFAAVNTSSAMVPPGGRTKVFGSNPLAFGVPAGRHRPLLLDISTSAIAGGKLRIPLLEGRQLPEGLVADSQGQPTTDPRAGSSQAGGSLLPLGWPHAAHKGFGLAMMVDILAGVLSGAGFAQTASVQASSMGQFYWALDVEAFMPLADFTARVDEQIDQVKMSERIDGVDEILVPGERGLRRREALLVEGTMPLSETVWRQVLKGCEAVGCAPPPSETLAENRPGS